MYYVYIYIDMDIYIYTYTYTYTYTHGSEPRMIGDFRMIHPGFGPNHPTNQDDRLKNKYLFVFFSEMFGFSS